MRQTWPLLVEKPLHPLRPSLQNCGQGLYLQNGEREMGFQVGALKQIEVQGLAATSELGLFMAVRAGAEVHRLGEWG